MNIFGTRFLFLAVIALTYLALNKTQAADHEPLYVYQLSDNGTPAAYDEAMAAACLQGILNQDAPRVYLVAKAYTRPQYWLDVLSKEGEWLHGREIKKVPDLDSLAQLAGDRVKGVVIWDPTVPATVDVASTIAGVSQAVVLSPEFAERYMAKWKLPLIKDLRGMFTGKETGSKKNDAYRWAIREYLAKGLCSKHRIFLSEDSFGTRPSGAVGYPATVDWVIKNRSFVFDLSPWGDEAPQDDIGQKVGLDQETYKMILAELLRQTGGKEMTELDGFFSFGKYTNWSGHQSTHMQIPTEMQSQDLISAYNCYQSTATSSTFNQSFHSQAPLPPLKQSTDVAKSESLGKKTYICILMADYDSSYPLYDFFPKFWDDPKRGKVPLTWGIDPNLLETFPDIIGHFYRTATPNDNFQADAGAAGYILPNTIPEQYLPIFVDHNKKFYQMADMSISPMVVDFDQPTSAVKDAFAQFSPNGFGSLADDTRGKGGKSADPQIWKGMPIIPTISEVPSTGDGFKFVGADTMADTMSHSITVRGNQQPGFYLFRIVWISASNMVDTLDVLKAKRPDLDIEVIDMKTFFSLFKTYESKKAPASP
jgi:GxGYxYP putative glycoside hydrolase C-terminal domain/GxGYxY sequence motif in domain of unknown function N-terminal